MFWNEIDPNLTPRLKAAIDRAYEVFAGYRVDGTIVHCDCPVCMTAETAEALSTLPLDEIDAPLLAEYTNSAHGYDDGDIEREFRHFLPRYLDLIGHCRPPSALGLETCLHRLGSAEYRDRWPTEEVAAVDEFFLAFLEACIPQLGLLKWPVGMRLAFDLDEVLIMIVQAGGDLDAALDAFDAAPDPQAATHMASMRQDVRIEDGRTWFRQAHLSDYPAAADAIGAFLMRDSVSERIAAAAALLDDPDYDGVLALGM